VTLVALRGLRGDAARGEVARAVGRVGAGASRARGRALVRELERAQRLHDDETYTDMPVTFVVL